MLSFLKDHLFAVDAFFNSSIVLTFAFPKEELQHLIPECLELDTFDDKFAFIAVAIVQTKELRPAGMPKFFGSEFFLIGYRVFVRYTNNEGKRVRGLYILRTETNTRKMEMLGKIFTHYNYFRTDIDISTKDLITTIESKQSGLNISVAIEGDDVALPEGSPFNNWKEARRFAGPLPFTFTYQPDTKKVLIIEGVRENWQPNPVKVVSSDVPFLDSLNLDGKILANAFIIKDIPYRWKKGRSEIWNENAGNSRV